MRILYFILALFIHQIVNGQLAPDTSFFRSPLDIPLYLSGTFGELRSNHFHSGLDIKTQGTIGHPIHAVADGYVSRIKIQSGGYGRSIYFSHPGGYTTVYGHLDAYTSRIEEYVKAYQYSVQQYEIDIYPPKNKLQFKKGEVIAISGNSGRSGGPHLHFEIRDSKNQSPQNGSLYGFDITDNLNPQFYNLALYQVDSENGAYNLDQLIDLQRKTGSVQLKDTLLVSQNTGFGLEAYDYTNFSANRCGVFSIALFIDSAKYYYSKVDEVPFNETRYINSHIDYGLKNEKGIKIQKLFIDPNNQLSIYKIIKNSGIVQINDTLIHNASVVITDAYNNRSELNFKFQLDPEKPNYELPINKLTFFPFKENRFDTTNVYISTSVKAFYKAFNINYKRIPLTKNTLSDLYQLHLPTEPIQKSIEIGIKPKIPYDSIVQADKMVIVKIGDKNQRTGYPGKWKNGFLTITTRSFGDYTIEPDTINPFIQGENIYNGKTFYNNQSIDVKITDNLTGIANYKAYIDGQWALFEYDAKNDRIFYRIDANRLQKNTTHDLEIYVTDGIGNTGSYFTTFKY